MRAYRLHLGEQALVYRLAYNGDVVGSKWAAGKGSVLAYRRIGVSGDAFFATRGTVGTRSRAIRGSTSDDRVGCSASDSRCAPARPALDVSTRLLPFLPCALASIDGIRPFPLLRLL